MFAKKKEVRKSSPMNIDPTGGLNQHNGGIPRDPKSVHNPFKTTKLQQVGQATFGQWNGGQDLQHLIHTVDHEVNQLYNTNLNQSTNEFK